MPWVFGLPLSASLHYKKIGLGGYTIQADSAGAFCRFTLGWAGEGPIKYN